jgi:hypothetical protein
MQQGRYAVPEPVPNPGVRLTAYSLRSRSGFQQQLTPSVDMTSDVKSWSVSFYMFFLLSYSVIGRGEANQSDG